MQVTEPILFQTTEEISDQNYSTTISYVENEKAEITTKVGAMYKLYALFITYSFIGWIWETLITSIDTGTFQKRGFLDVPLLPIYGFAIIFITSIFYGKGYSLTKIFFGSALIISVQEFITSWGLEMMFHKVWWDYSQMRFQIQGRVCLIGAIVFGTASVLIIRFVHPKIEKKIDQFFTQSNSKKLCVFSLGLICADVVFSIIRLL